MSTAPVLLPSLIRSVLDGLDRAYIEEGAGRDGMPSIDLWANLLRAIDDNGANRQDLPSALRLSKRAVRSRISSAVRNRWVEDVKVADLPEIRLTTCGSAIARNWKSLQDAAEERWRAKVGPSEIDNLRASLQDVVARMPLEHPHYPASYGAADASITGGNGQDWKPVRRQSGDTVSFLPLSALLSEALVAFALEYEEKSPVALSLSTTVIKRIPPEGRPESGLGHSAGISALDRHGFLHRRLVDGKNILSLTPKGAAVAQACDGWIREVETNWRHRFGDQPYDRLRQALERSSRAACIKR